MIEVIGEIYGGLGFYLIMVTSFLVPFYVPTEDIPFPLILIINRITIGVLFFCIICIVWWNIGVVLFDFEYRTIPELFFG